MPVRIFKDTSAPVFVVEWLEDDGFTRARKFGSFRSAQRYADQVECRLMLDATKRDAA